MQGLIPGDHLSNISWRRSDGKWRKALLDLRQNGSWSGHRIIRWSCLPTVCGWQQAGREGPKRAGLGRGVKSGRESRTSLGIRLSFRLQRFGLRRLSNWRLGLPRSGLVRLSSAIERLRRKHQPKHQLRAMMLVGRTMRRSFRGSPKTEESWKEG